MSDPPDAATFPCALPADRGLRIQLIAIRRMVAGGLQDSTGSWMMLMHFRRDARRRLVLLRGLILELARSSQRRIRLAPCCAPRLTADEARIVALLAFAHGDPDKAVTALQELTGSADCTGPLSLAAMLDRNGLPGY